LVDLSLLIHSRFRPSSGHDGVMTAVKGITLIGNQFNPAPKARPAPRWRAEESTDAAPFVAQLESRASIEVEARSTHS
jgi:hypothetical protein